MMHTEGLQCQQQGTTHHTMTMMIPPSVSPTPPPPQPQCHAADWWWGAQYCCTAALPLPSSHTRHGSSESDRIKRDVSNTMAHTPNNEIDDQLQETHTTAVPCPQPPTQQAGSSAEWWAAQRAAVEAHRAERHAAWVGRHRGAGGQRVGEAATLQMPQMNFHDRCISRLALVTEAANQAWQRERAREGAVLRAARGGPIHEGITRWMCERREVLLMDIHEHVKACHRQASTENTRTEAPNDVRVTWQDVSNRTAFNEEICRATMGLRLFDARFHVFDAA